MLRIAENPLLSPTIGTEGYAEQAAELFERYESTPFPVVHNSILHLIPSSPCRVVDIGSGTGRDAAWFAAMGHNVLAVEPTDEMRIPASRLHTSPNIEWLDDCLPHLSKVLARNEVFDLIMLTAVWMHLDEREREEAMPRLASLLRAGGIMVMKIRHGPVPPKRRMFNVSAYETIQLAKLDGLHPILHLSTETSRDTGVTWTRLAFTKATGHRSQSARSGDDQQGRFNGEILNTHKRTTR
jgi:protein-L-isoaspartate O-methyltransferase